MMSRSRPTNQRGSAVIIIVVLVVVLAVAGAIAYLVVGRLSGDKAAPGLPLIGHKSITATTPTDVKALLLEAKAGKYDAKCTYDDGQGKSGTIYVSGSEKMRVDTAIEKKPGHIVRLSDAGYIWADGDSKGSKLPFRSGNASSTYSADKFIENAEKYKVHCESVGKLSDSLFTLPKNVTFVDFNEQLKTQTSGQ